MFDIGKDHYYYDDHLNESILRRIAHECYLPTNQLLLDLIQEHKGAFRVSFSISGLALDQFELYAPEVLESFQKLAQTGCVEFLAETYSHSLASIVSKEEFMDQVQEHRLKIEHLFGTAPKAFRNTELIYSDIIGNDAHEMGFETIVTEGASHILDWRSPNYLYSNAQNPDQRLLLRNYKLSDDIAFRFSNESWEEYPLTASKYVKWLRATDPQETNLNLFMDYETFGEHQKPSTGIMEFLRQLPKAVIADSDFHFATVSEAAQKHLPEGDIHVPNPISWADEERNLSAWLGNEMQQEAFRKLYYLKDSVNQIEDKRIQKDWQYLQASDHFYYMSTKFFSDGDVHAYFNPYYSPYDAFINYMNILSDFKQRVEKICKPVPLEDEIKLLKKQLHVQEQQIKNYQVKLRSIKPKETVTVYS